MRRCWRTLREIARTGKLVAHRVRLRFLPPMPDKGRILRFILPLFIALVVVLYQRGTAPKIVNEAGRTARLGMNPQQELALGGQAYRQVLSESRTVTSGPGYEMVKNCAARLTAVTGDAGKNFQWQVSVVESGEVNAFCLPGGKIVVYTGIIPVAQSEAGLAVVMGHEIAHATNHHGAERVLQEKTANTLLTGANFSLSGTDPQQHRQIMGLIGAGARIGVLLPFSRDHESEADSVGLRYMARAGYDPREAVRFWERMSAQGGGKAPPQFLSTHPAHETRIARLKKELPKAIEIYQSAGGR
jgi:predicted Zn-dependent protease